MLLRKIRHEDPCSTSHAIPQLIYANTSATTDDILMIKNVPKWSGVWLRIASLTMLLIHTSREANMLESDNYLATVQFAADPISMESCPKIKHCQSCAPDDFKAAVVDLLLLAPYRDVDLCQSPCKVPPCGHILTTESMDGQMELLRLFQTNQAGEFIGLQALAPAFSMEDINVCSTCRGSLRSVSRYGHVVRRALIDESAKKFILWANKEYSDGFRVPRDWPLVQM